MKVFQAIIVDPDGQEEKDTVIWIKAPSMAAVQLFSDYALFDEIHEIDPYIGREDGLDYELNSNGEITWRDKQ